MVSAWRIVLTSAAISPVNGSALTPVKRTCRTKTSGVTRHTPANPGPRRHSAWPPSVETGWGNLWPAQLGGAMAPRGTARPHKERVMANITRIEETTAAELEGWRVTAGNLMADDYVDAQGGRHHGLTIELGLYDADGACHGEPTVGPGSVVAIAGVAYRVVEVARPDPDDNGFVTLTRS